jgi:hypothetical protein
MKSKDALYRIGITFVVGILANLPGPTKAQDLQNSVMTVEELLRIDNAHALEKARLDAIKSGLVQAPKQVQQPGQRHASVASSQWSVRSIFGAGDRMQADIVVDDVHNNSVGVGNTVAMCRIDAIEDACIRLVPASQKTPKGVCPAKVCWTGSELAAELRPPQTSAAPPSMSNKVMPSPLPAPAIPLPTGSDGPSIARDGQSKNR